MPKRVLVIVGLFGLTAILSGCRLTGRNGPISPALAKCREYSQQGVIALEQGRAESAEQLLSKAVESCPKDAEARRHYAEALWKRGQHDKAIAQLEEAIELTPEDSALRVRLVEMRLASKQIQRAQKEIEAVLDVDPRLGSAWAMRARVLHASGDAKGALIDYHRALELTPDDRDLLLETAELYRELNQPDKALALLHHLIDTYGPGEEPQKVVYLEGLAYAALGQDDQAVEKFTTVLSRGRPTPELLYQLAVVRCRVGQPREAALAAEAALRLEPNHVPSRQLIEQLSMARSQESATHR